MNDILICSRIQAYVDRTKSGHNKLQSKAKPNGPKQCFLL